MEDSPEAVASLFGELETAKFMGGESWVHMDEAQIKVKRGRILDSSSESENQETEIRQTLVETDHQDCVASNVGYDSDENEIILDTMLPAPLSKDERMKLHIIAQRALRGKRY